MCPKCPNFSSREGELYMHHYHKRLNDLEEHTDALLRMATDCEDQYRRTGITYHTTQSLARQSSEITPDCLIRLKEAFEIRCLEEYQALFAPLTNIVQHLTDLRSKVQHAGFKGTVPEHHHHMEFELIPGLRALIDDLAYVFNGFITLDQDAAVLHHVSQIHYETDGNGHRIAWQDPFAHRSNGELFVPARMQDEWAKFRAWVWSLPETQRTVMAGYRSLDEVALELVFSEPEMGESSGGVHGLDRMLSIYSVIS